MQADDLYAMAGTMNHLTRILEDMTNAIERLGMRWKEKSLTIVAGPFTEYKPGDVVEIISNSGIRWIWRVVEGMEALGTWLDNRGCSEASMWHRISKANSMFYAKKALFCDPKLPVKRRIDAFYSTCVPASLHGAGEWAYTQSMFQALRIWELGKVRRVLCLRRRPNECWVDYMKRTGVETQPTTRANSGYETCSYCCLADGELVERCEGSQILGRICDMALRRNVERRIHQTVQRRLSEQHAVETSSPRQTELFGASFRAFLGRRLDTETEGLQCKTWTERPSLIKQFEHSWHVMLNLKPSESSCVCDFPVERSRRPRDDSDPWNVAWPSDTHRRLEVLGDNKVV